MESLYCYLVMAKHRRLAELQKAFDAHQGEKKRSSRLRGKKVLEGKKSAKKKRFMLILPLKRKNSEARAYFLFRHNGCN